QRDAISELPADRCQRRAAVAISLPRGETFKAELGALAADAGGRATLVAASSFRTPYSVSWPASRTSSLLGRWRRKKLPCDRLLPTASRRVPFETMAAVCGR